MKSYVIDEKFGLDNLVMVDRPIPEPGPGEVLIQLRAVSLNYRDLLVVQGAYNPRQNLPFIPCSDGVGDIMALGPEVDGLSVGDRVSPIFALDWLSGPPLKTNIRTTLGSPVDGTLTEWMVAPARSVVSIPEHLSDAEAATLPCAGVTAWSALVTLGGLRPGDVVLTLGTGGVSIWALQLAQLRGAQVIVTSSSDAKLERARTLGASHTINYVDEPQWGKAIKALTGGTGVDHVIEVGGAGTLEQSLRAVRIGGRISLIGVLSGTEKPLNILPVLMGNICVQGVLVGHRESFVDLCGALASSQTKPVIDSIYSFDQAQQAFEHLASGDHFGKVCISVRREDP